VWAPGLVWMSEKISPPPEFDPEAVQPGASLYAYYAVIIILIIIILILLLLLLLLLLLIIIIIIIIIIRTGKRCECRPANRLSPSR
jgi:hypothetical protein